MNTTTSTIPAELPFAFIISRLWIYVLQGIMLLGCNSVIVISILYHRELRKNKSYALPCALAIIDTSDGIAAIVGGLGRNILIYSYEANDPVSRWDCLIAPWNAIWIVIGHIVDPTFLAISIDRLIAVAWPLWHFTAGKYYGIGLVACAWGFGSLFLAYCCYLSYQYQEPERPAICFTNFALDDGYYQFHYWYRIVLSLGSVLLYALVLIVYAARRRRQNTGSTDFKTYNNTQRKLTITLGMSSLFTFVLYIVPMFFNAILPKIMPLGMASEIISSTYIIQNMNKLVNLFLYSLRHRDLRLGIEYLFSCKVLTTEAIKQASRKSGSKKQQQSQASSKPNRQKRNTIGTIGTGHG